MYVYTLLIKFYELILVKLTFLNFVILTVCGLRITVIVNMVTENHYHHSRNGSLFIYVSLPNYT